MITWLCAFISLESLTYYLHNLMNERDKNKNTDRIALHLINVMLSGYILYNLYLSYLLFKLF